LASLLWSKPIAQTPGVNILFNKLHIPQVYPLPRTPQHTYSLLRTILSLKTSENLTLNRKAGKTTVLLSIKTQKSSEESFTSSYKEPGASGSCLSSLLQEAEIRRITVQGQPKENSLRDSTLKNPI
jgi:hypothetical protein